jgi:uncharacterized membrane protein YfcA
MLYYILYILYNVCYIIEYIPGLFTWSNNFTAGLNMDRNKFNIFLSFLLLFHFYYLSLGPINNTKHKTQNNMRNTQQNRNNLAFMFIGFTVGFLTVLILLIP